jgi:hypothetical protein
VSLRNRVERLSMKVEKVSPKEPEELSLNEKQLLCLSMMHEKHFLNDTGTAVAGQLYIKSYSAEYDSYWAEELKKLTDEELNQLELMIYERDRKDFFGMPTLDSDPVYDPAYLNRYLRSPETFPDDIREYFKRMVAESYIFQQ